MLRRGARSRPRAASAFSGIIVIRGVDVESPRPRTRVYIDGFNFYCAAFRRGGFADYKWLDLVRFCERALPRNDIELVHTPAGGPRTVEVWVPEEKGSDVNLASHLLLDAVRGAFDVAVVISNDADLRDPVRMAREELSRTVGVLRVEGGQRRCSSAGGRKGQRSPLMSTRH